MKVQNYLMMFVMCAVAWQNMYAADKTKDIEKAVCAKVLRDLAQGADERNIEDSSLRKFIRGLAVGGASGVLEVTVDQPLVKAGTCAIAGKPFPWKEPRIWWAGYRVNAGSMGPITAIQMSVNAFLRSMLVDEEGHLDDGKKVFCAALAGWASGFVSSPAEYAMICQQETGRALCPTAQEIFAEGWKRGVYRGFWATATRDMLFTTGYLAVAPLAKRKMKTFYDNEAVANICGGIAAGVPTAIATQPLNVVATRMKLDAMNARMHLGNVYDMRETIRRLYLEGGVVSLWSGGCARGTRVVAAITLMSAVEGPLTEMFSKLGL